MKARYLKGEKVKYQARFAKLSLGAPEEVPESVQFPIRALAGLDRIHLKKEEFRKVALHLSWPTSVFVYEGR